MQDYPHLFVAVIWDITGQVEKEYRVILFLFEYKCKVTNHAWYITSGTCIGVCRRLQYLLVVDLIRCMLRQRVRFSRLRTLQVDEDRHQKINLAAIVTILNLCIRRSIKNWRNTPCSLFWK